MKTPAKNPLLFCFIGPGASGKSSICTALAEDRDLPVFLSVSSTTRAPRPYEKEGREYFFLSREDFAKRLSNGAFLEHAEFAGNLYGTQKKNVETASQLQKNLLLDIEIQGVVQLKKAFPEDIVVVFICPPSIEELRERFKARGSDTDERIEERIRLAREEIRTALAPGFSDYVIINETLDKSILHARGVILGEMVHRDRLDDAVLARFNVT